MEAKSYQKTGIHMGLILVIVLLTGGVSLQGEDLSFYRGADISSLPELESDSVLFRDNSITDDALSILKMHGINSIRIRLWHTPDEPWNGLNKTLEMAQRIKNAGLHFLLDIHYSDWWADPAHQTPPSVWDALTVDEMADSVYNYTSHVMSSLLNVGALPDMVQIGNEIGCGMLWPLGAVCGENDTAEQWQNLAGFINAGVQAVADAAGDSVQIMIHDFRGGDASGALWFYSHLDEYGVEYDVIGLSYYPWWHGDLSDLAANMGNLAYTFEKPVVVVETAYPWTLAWNDNTNNIVGSEDQLLSGYPATPAGQAQFLSDLMDRVEDVWGGYGSGVYYWEPAWTSGASSGSPWENLALFDFEGGALEGLRVFQEPVGVSNAEPVNKSNELIAFPNPSNGMTRISFKLDDIGRNHLRIHTIEGREVLTRAFNGTPNSRLSWEWNQTSNSGQIIPSGLYILSQQGGGSSSRKVLIIK